MNSNTSMYITIIVVTFSAAVGQSKHHEMNRIIGGYPGRCSTNSRALRSRSEQEYFTVLSGIFIIPISRCFCSTSLDRVTGFLVRLQNFPRYSIASSGHSSRFIKPDRIYLWSIGRREKSVRTSPRAYREWYHGPFGGLGSSPVSRSKLSILGRDLRDFRRRHCHPEITQSKLDSPTSNGSSRYSTGELGRVDHRER